MLLHLFRSLLPFENPIGFGASDFLELLLTALLVSLVLAGPAIVRSFRRLGERTAWSMFLLAVLPLILRLLLFSHHPAPSPDNYRDFARVLAADTLRHFRLTNPAHPLPQFFETLAVVETPSYSSIVPPGQGMLLALGRAVFGHPWTGVLLPVAAFCSLSYWMLRAWTTPGWALAGGLLTVFQFGPLSQWTNGYGSGAASAAAACLVFGSLPRLRARGRMRDAALLGLGVSGYLLTLPYESVFLLLSAVVFVLPSLLKLDERSRLTRAALLALALVVSALLLTLFHDKFVTGSWTMTPAALSRYQYGAPASLTFEPEPLPHRELTPQQQLFHRMQISLRGTDSESVASYFSRLEYRVRWYRFFLFAPMYLGVLAFIFSIRRFADFWLLLTLAIFALAVNFEADLEFAQLAATAPLLILLGVQGLQRLSRFRIRGRLVGREAAHWIAFLCAVHFLFWYGLHLFESHETAAAMMQHETWDSINHDGQDRRGSVYRQIARLPGRQLVFVHYSAAHRFQDEWVYNDADIDGARTIWARDLGASENQRLQRYYPDRSVWLLDPDESPPLLIPYRPEPPGSRPDNSTPETAVPSKPTTGVSPFEPIH